MAEPIMEKEPTPNPGTEPAPVVDTTAELKQFMGDAYKEGVTIEEINEFLKGKKYADLNSGNYVGKKKYDDLEKKHNDYLELTKDFESLKNEVANYKQKEQHAALQKQALAANIDEQFIDYALTQIDPEEKNTEKALKEWAKGHPQFLKLQQRVIESGPSLERGKRPVKDVNGTINGNLRAAVGKQQ